MTIPKFGSYVCPGDTITIHDGLYTFTARIEPDCDVEPGDVGEVLTAEEITAWLRDEWYY